MLAEPGHQLKIGFVTEAVSCRKVALETCRGTIAESLQRSPKNLTWNAGAQVDTQSIYSLICVQDVEKLIFSEASHRP